AVPAEFIVPAPELIQRRDGDEEKPARNKCAVNLIERPCIIGNVLQDVEQKRDIPAVAPGQIKEVDLVRGHVCRQEVRSFAQRGLRRIGERALRLQETATPLEIINPTPAAPTQVDNRQRLAPSVLSSNGPRHCAKQEAMSPPIPEMLQLHP